MISKERLLELGEIMERVETSQGLKVNTKIGNSPYSIEGILSRGDWSITYLTRNEVSKDRFVVKEFFPVGNFGEAKETIGLCRVGNRLVVKGEGTEDHWILDQYKSDFRHNGHQLIGLQQLDCLVPVVDVFDANNTVYQVMVYTPYPSLSTVLKHHLLKPEEAMAIFRGLLASVDKLHGMKMVHKTLCPHNIFITDHRVLFGDFQVTGHGTMIHNCLEGPFVAPEVKAKGLVDARSDLYSLGRILEYLLEHIGFRPNDANLHMGHGVDWSKLMKVLEKTLEPTLDKRSASLEDLGEILRSSGLARDSQGVEKQWFLVVILMALMALLFLGIRSFMPEGETDNGHDTGYNQEVIVAK